MIRFKIGALLTVVALMGTAAARAPQPATQSSRMTGSTATLPSYPIPYHVPRVETVTRQLLRLKSRLEATVMTSLTTRPATEPDNIRRVALNTYAMGVVYSGMLNAWDATGDKSFASFVSDRLQIIADAIRKVDLNHLEPHRGDVTYLLSPKSLDDCGSIGAAMIKARRAGIGPDLLVVIDHIAPYIHSRQLRIDDGILARGRPFENSVWSDDTYMSIPFLAQFGTLMNDPAYFDDAATQMLHFKHYLFVPSMGLFTHHYNTSNPDNQPKYYWGRANGWCAMAMAELLDVLPSDHPLRGQVLRLFRDQAQAIATCQAADGLWHQMLDRTDSYTETSCSGMFVYALARGVNRGWLDAGTYGPVAVAGWDGLGTRIDDNGRLTGTCIGTSYADDYVYYYHRPASEDIHGYGPALLAGSEIIHLLKNPHYRVVGGERGSPIMVVDRATYIPPPPPEAP